MNCGRTGHNTPECPTLMRNRAPYRVQPLNGRNLRIRDQALEEGDFTGKRCWNKFLRWRLSSEDKIAFDKAASGYVLSKANKLRVTQVTTEDKDILTNLLNTHNQVRDLKAHIKEYDIDDGFTVVIPINENSPKLQPRKFDLFVDYPQVTPQMVALSNRYLNMWVEEQFVNENLNLTYTLIKNNTDDILFGQCLEEYEKYLPMCQGGPLMFIIVMRKINSINARYREHMWTRVKALEIRKIQGENVNQVVSLLNAAYNTFRAVSTDPEGMNCVPQDWSEHVIKILQTSTVSKFNEIFEHEEELAYRAAARTQGQPEWPTHDVLMTWASSQYERFKQANEWDVPTSVSKKGYKFNRNGERDLSKATCDNCLQKGHLSTDCRRERDDERIKKNRKARIEKARQARSSSQPQANAATTTATPKVTATGNEKEIKIDGLVYKLNKESTWTCTDPSKVQERKEKGIRKQAAKATRTANPTAPSPQANLSSTPTSSSGNSTRNLQQYISNLM
jgi:hypothetical protein